MKARALKTLDLPDRKQWRKWLARHHATVSGIWLVFHRGEAARGSLSYEEALEEALCHGWIDSILKRVDESRYVRKFTPRRADSVWSTPNRRRYADLARRGLLAPPGLARPPTGRSGDAPRPSIADLPAYIEKGFRADRRAWKFFQQLAPSHRKAYVGWIDSAKREETKARRLREARELLAQGRKLGLK